MTGTHSGPLKSCSGLAGSSAQVFFFLLWWIPGVRRCPDLWCSGGGRPFPVDTFRKPHLPLPFASKMDSPLPLLRLPCHHPSRPPALPPAHGLPSRGLAGGGGGGGGSGVRQSPRLPDGEPPPPRRPKWREGRQLPRPRPLFVWCGGGELCLAPGAAGLCQSLPLLGLPGPRTLRALSARLGNGAHAQSGFLPGLVQHDPLALPVSVGRSGHEYNSGPLASSPGPPARPSTQSKGWHCHRIGVTCHIT